ncbi:MAG: hypothetical protein ACYCTB_11325 [bacterium]
MLFFELLFLISEIIFSIYLIRKYKILAAKEKTIAEELLSIRSRKESLIELEKMLKEDFAKELEERKKYILEEFRDRLNHNNMNIK